MNNKKVSQIPENPTIIEIKQFFKKLMWNILYVIVVLYVGKGVADYVSIRQFKKETTEAIIKSVKTDEFLNYWTLVEMKQTLETKENMDDQDRCLYRIVVEELNGLKSDLRTRGGSESSTASTKE